MNSSDLASSEQIKAIVKRYDVLKLLRHLSSSPSVQIRIKRYDRVHYGNPCIVARANGALIMLRDHQSAQPEVLDDIGLVQAFELTQDIGDFKKACTYVVA